MNVISRVTAAVVAGVLTGTLAGTLAVAQTAPSGAPLSLKTVAVPEPPNLSDFVEDKAAAIRLGKALFWDMQVGSDGVVACATCHFHAGADSRSINQMSPGLLNRAPGGAPAPDYTFDRGANVHLAAEFFPLRKLVDPTNRASPALQDTNDVVGSQGVFNAKLEQVIPGQAEETVTRSPDPDGFRVSPLNVRRVEPRHTPSVINAVYNYRNFWDGRAQNEFNGVNQWGDRDPTARVFRAPNNAKPLEPVRVRLINSSLASQAVAPIVSPTEMSADGRIPSDLGNKLTKQKGKKLAVARPLGLQLVHPDDSVLGKVSRWPNKGLTASSYDAMIRDAFRKEWWQSKRILRIESDGSVTDVGDKKKDLDENEYTLIEYNFSLFFGLAIQLYEATLVSDDTPYDRWREGRGTISSQALLGLQVFVAQDKVIDNGPGVPPTVLKTQGARCINCHAGPEFTDASITSISNPHPDNGTVRRKREGQEIDRGFNNVGVRPTMEDLGVGGKDPFGNPLSATAQCRMNPAGTFCPPTASTFLAVDGAFKAPGLRNVELTAPYFHNGSHLTLESVVELYSRGGDFAPLVAADGVTEIAPLSIPAIGAPQRGLSPDEQAALVAFLKTLTDERVRYQRAPFDHPQLLIPHGQLDDHVTVVADTARPGQARDRMHEIPAVGRNGGAPLPGFMQYK